MTTPPLFELPEGEPVKRSKSLRELDRLSRPVWTRYKPRNRVPCDECITLLHEAGGVGPYAKSARHKRTLEGKFLLLCDEHARLWRAEEAS
jgi:hypothetical protein